MKARLLLSILLLAIIGVGTVLLMLDQDDAGPVEVPRLSQVDARSIKTIKVSRNNMDTLLFTKEDGQWRLQAPTSFRAKQSRIDAILGILSSRSFYQIDATSADLELFQLAPPHISLQLNQLRFDFGGTEPIDERRYVMTGNSIHLINDSLFHQLRQASSFYASDRLIAENESVANIDFHALPNVKENRLSALQLAWQNARARKVKSYRRSRDSVETTVKVAFSSGHSAIFDVISTSPVLVLGRADIGLQYSFDAEQSEKLLPVTQ